MGVWGRIANVFNPKAEIIESLPMEEWARLISEATGVRTTSGVSVSPESALRHSTVLICQRVLAESVASLPCILYKRRKDGGKDRATDHPLYKVLHDQANSWNTSFEYFEGTMCNLASRGNGYSFVDRNSKGQTVGLVPLNPDGVEIKQAADWSPTYSAIMPDNIKHKLSRLEMHHITGPLPRGYKGRSIITLAREAIGLGLATEKFGSSLFENGAKPSGILKHPKVLTTPAQDRLKEQLAARHTGLENAHKPLILEEGLEWVALSINPDDAQFLETRKFQRSEIAGIFRVPAHFVNDMEKATFSNIEHQSLDFVIHSLRPWLKRIEQAINRDLLTASEREQYFVEFLIDDLLRGDFFNRMQGYALQIQNRLATPNEVRSRENQNPIEGGDKLVETNNISAPPKKGGANKEAIAAMERNNEALRASLARVENAITVNSNVDKRYVQDRIRGLEESNRDVERSTDGKILAVERNILNSLDALIIASSKEAVAPIINVTTPDIHIVTPPVAVTVHQEQRGTTRKIVESYDDDGRIKSMIEEQVQD